MSSNNKTSHLIASQLPQFVREDDGNFQAFLEAYYQFLEQQNGVIGQAQSLRSNFDIDTSLDQFTEHLNQVFLKIIPKEVIADKKLILKHAKDFYRARGTEKSIEFLLRILFGVDASFYYPKSDILRASDGKWFIEKSLKIFDIKIDGVSTENVLDAKKFERLKVTGVSSHATAIVEKVEIYHEGPVLVKELRLSNQTTDFISNEVITTSFFDETNTERILTATTFGAGITDVKIVNPGTGYTIGQKIPVEGVGTGADLEIADVSTGNIKSIYVVSGGAGFRKEDLLSITSESGTGATGNVLSVLTDSSVHPNSYNIVVSSISSVASVNIGNNIYSGLNASVVDPANNWISNSMAYMIYANTGPIVSAAVIDSGSGYLTVPNISVQANSRIRELGILGRMEIVDGGLNYAIGDKISFINSPGSYGMGATANVTNVSAEGAITAVQFKTVPGYVPGGQGFSPDLLPKTSITSANGNGANVIVTALLGYGENLRATSDSLGAIKKITIRNSGSGYTQLPTINLKSIGDGTANAVPSVIQGAFVYPGRYLNDDGQLSSHNFLQDKDYYQNFSYVVKTRQSIDKYRKYIKDLIHPGGLKLFGEYLVSDSISANTQLTDTKFSLIILGNYTSTANAMGSKVTISIPRDITTLNLTSLEFATGNGRGNLADGLFEETGRLVNSIIVFQANNKANLVNGSGTVYVGITPHENLSSYVFLLGADGSFLTGTDDQNLLSAP